MDAHAPPPAAPPSRPPSIAVAGRGRGRGQPAADAPAAVIQTGRGAAGGPPAATAGGGGARAESAMSSMSAVSSVAPPSPAGSRAPSVAGSIMGDPDKRAQEKAMRAKEKELRKEPLPLGWKVYVSRSTGKPYWHHKDSNETRWTKPGIGPADAKANDENAPPPAQQDGAKGLLQSLDEKLKSRAAEAPPAPTADERKREEERLKREEEERKREEDEKRKAAYRKKAEDARNELDLSSLVQAAATKEQATKEAESAARQQPGGAQANKSRLLSLSKSAAEAAEKEAAQKAKEGRWWDQVDKDARDIAAGEMQPGADASAFPVLSKMGKTAASVTASRATSRAQSTLPGDPDDAAAQPAGRSAQGGQGGPASMEVDGGAVTTPVSIGIGIRSPVGAGWDGGGGAKFHEEAGDLATAEKMYLATGAGGVAMAAEMYVRHKRIGDAVRVTRAGASGKLEAEGLVFDLIQKAVKAEHNTEKAAQLLEEYCGAEHAVQLALERGVFPVALGVATRNRAAMHMVPEIRFAHGDAVLRAGKFEEASDLFVRANRHLAAAQLYGLLGQWDKAAAVASRHKGGEAKAWVEACRHLPAPLPADAVAAADNVRLGWESQGLTRAQAEAVRALVDPPPTAAAAIVSPGAAAVEAGWGDQSAGAGGVGADSGGHAPAAAAGEELEGSPATNDVHVEGKFLTLVPSSGAPSARSSLDMAAFGHDAQQGDGAQEPAVRPSTAKRELDKILKSQLDIKNIHVSAEAAEAGWGMASARSGRSEGSSYSAAGPGNAASAAKSQLQKLLSQDDAEVESERAAGGVGEAGEFDDLKDKVKAYKARKAAQRASSEQTANTSADSGQSTEEGGDKMVSEYDTTIDACLSVMMGPTKTADYLQDLWLRAATIAQEHVPRRKTEVVTEVTDRLIKLGRDRAAAELCLSAGFHKEALKTALRARLWDVGDRICLARPDLKKELEAARALAAEDIEENLVPFAEYVRKGREKRLRSVPLATKIARTICCCGAAPEADDDDIDAALARERAQSKGLWSRCFSRGKEDDGGQAAKSRDWGAGVDDRLAPPTGVLGRVCFPCFVVVAVCAPYYRELREKLVRLRNVYPLFGMAQALGMVVISRQDLSAVSFDERSDMRPTADGTQVRIAVPENNWTLPLHLSRQLVCMVALFAMWVCWERQRYYRQLVSSPALMQAGLLLINVSSVALFAHLHYVLEWHYVVAQDAYDCAYYACHSAGIGLLCFGVKRSWWDLMSLVIVPATALVYLETGPDLRWAVYLLQTPLAAMLALKLFRVFQDVRLLLVPAFLVLLHLGFSCLLLYLHSTLIVILRDLLGDVVGCLLLCLCIWVIPGTIEWVEDEDLADLQGVGDAETAREQLEKIREKRRVPKGYETLYEVNKARQDAERLKELVSGQNPDMYAELQNLYSRSSSRAASVQSRNSAAPLPLEQRRGDLAALRSSVLESNGAAFDYASFGAPPRPNSHFSDAPGKSLAQTDPRRSRDFSRPPSHASSVASAAAVELDVSAVSHLWRSPVTPRVGGAASAAEVSPGHGHTPHVLLGRERSYSQMSVSSQGSAASAASHHSHHSHAAYSQAPSAAPPPPSAPGNPQAPRAVPDGFAIQLDKLPQEGRKFVLKESLRQDAALDASGARFAPSPAASLGPAERDLRRNDSAMSSASSPPRSSRATPNGRPKKSPGAGRGYAPPPPGMPPGTPRTGPPMSSAGWGMLMHRTPGPDAADYGSRAGSVSGDDDAMSVASVSSVGSSASNMGRGRGRGRGSSASSTPLPPPPGVQPPPPPGAQAPAMVAPLSALAPLPAAPPQAMVPLPPPQGAPPPPAPANRPPPPSGPPVPAGGPVRPRSKPR